MTAWRMALGKENREKGKNEKPRTKTIKKKARSNGTRLFMQGVDANRA
jgi:hypothetical protein